MNNLPIEVLVKIPYTTNGILGGIITPRVPPAAMQPLANFCEYLYFIISGKDTFPITTAQAVLEPLVAANSPQPPMVASASPPRI